MEVPTAALVLTTSRPTTATLLVQQLMAQLAFLASITFLVAITIDFLGTVFEAFKETMPLPSFPNRFERTHPLPLVIRPVSAPALLHSLAKVHRLVIL